MSANKNVRKWVFSSRNRERGITELSQPGESFGGCEWAKRECVVSFDSPLCIFFFLELLINLMTALWNGRERSCDRYLKINAKEIKRRDRYFNETSKIILSSEKLTLDSLQFFFLMRILRTRRVRKRTLATWGSARRWSPPDPSRAMHGSRDRCTAFPHTSPPSPFARIPADREVQQGLLASSGYPQR